MQKKYYRRSIRLSSYDYSQEGGYFITICTHNRESIFGEVVNGEMVLNEKGIIVEEHWLQTKIIRPHVELDTFVIMPNHFHGIIMLDGDDSFGSLGAIVGHFKSITAKCLRKMQNRPDLKIWQRNYFEHVIRNGKDLQRICEYIKNNPLEWSFDEENPSRHNV
jgi:putative transposase